MPLSSVSSLKTEAESGFRAELRGLTLFDLVQLECSRGECRRRVLRVVSVARAGSLFFDGGQITHATTDRLSGEAAVLEILSWPSGTLHEVDQPWPERPTVITSWQGLLMRAAQYADEERARRDGFGSVRRLSSRERAEPSAGDVLTVGIRGPEAQQPGAAQSASIRAVRLSGRGDIVRQRGQAEELAQVAAFVAHMAERVGNSLGLDRFTSVDWTGASKRTLVYMDGSELQVAEGERGVSIDDLRGAAQL